MKVSLVAVTQPLVTDENGNALTAEQFIVYCARVSNPSNQLNLDTAPKLLAYCVKNRHWSIFEQASMTVEIVTSRAIAQQILRHRSFSFQEFSQRYAVATEFESVELRKQGATNRQGGEEPIDGTTRIILDNEDVVTMSDAMSDLLRHSNAVYKGMLQAGVAKECARMVLPLCTQTRLYMTGNVRSWIHYLQVRCDPHTQKEHREIANVIMDKFRSAFPNTCSAVWPA